MNKQNAVQILTKSAQMYEAQFCNKNLLVVFDNPSAPRLLKTKATSANFLHLTGVILNEPELLKSYKGRQTNLKDVFYEKCLTNRLSPDDFELKKDGTTAQKLNVIQAILNLPQIAKMIGDFNNNRIYLKTDKIVGNSNAYMGLIFDNGYYVPNTVISGDIRKDTTSPSRVLAILSKDIKEPTYNEIKYVAKKIDINLLLQKIQKDISIAPDLLLPSQRNISTPPKVNLFSNATPSGGAAVLAPPRPIFGQAVSAFMGKIKQFFEDKSTENQRLIKDLKKAISKRDAQLAERNDEIADLKRECAELSNQLEKQKQLVTATAKPTKTFAQGLDEMLQKQYTSKSIAPKQQPSKTSKPKL